VISRIAGIMTAIEDGMYQPAMKARMDGLERQKAEIMARMAEAPADVPDVHPNIAEIYKTKVVRLTEALVDPELHSEAADAIRSLVGEVVLTLGEKRGAIQAVLRGELMGILGFVAELRSDPRPEVITKGVAGPRFEPEPDRQCGKRTTGCVRATECNGCQIEWPASRSSTSGSGRATVS
jgi:hypothetical protein